MPFTPFHFGPGAFLKACLAGYFSFTLFVFTQVIIDLESLYYLAQGDWPVHRFLHTYLGSSVIVMLAVLVGKPICQIYLNMWNVVLNRKQNEMLYFSPNISYSSAFIGSALGAYSHVFLDSVMHSDSKPFAPFMENNSVLSLVSVSQLHLICVVAGLLGIIILIAVFYWKRFSANKK